MMYRAPYRGHNIIECHMEHLDRVPYRASYIFNPIFGMYSRPFSACFRCHFRHVSTVIFVMFSLPFLPYFQTHFWHIFRAIFVTFSQPFLGTFWEWFWLTFTTFQHQFSHRFLPSSSEIFVMFQRQFRQVLKQFSSRYHIDFVHVSMAIIATFRRRF